MTGTGPVGIGVIGTGVISETYLENLTSFPDVVVHAVGDLFEDSAAKRAAQFGIETSGGVDAVLSHPDVEIVVNLTIPTAHVPIALDAVAAGKHVVSEKPFSLDRESGHRLLAAADAAGVRVGCAPDTFLGAGLQAAFRAIHDGQIGTPLSALTLMQSPGPEAWHPNPAFLFQEGAGPLFDIGPYYLTALVQAFGSIARVAASGSTAHPRRTIGSGPKAGEEFDVTVPSHVGALLQFAARRLWAEHLEFRLRPVAQRVHRDLRDRGHAGPPRPEQLRWRTRHPPARSRGPGGPGLHGRDLYPRHRGARTRPGDP